MQILFTGVEALSFWEMPLIFQSSWQPQDDSWSLAWEGGLSIPHSNPLPLQHAPLTPLWLHSFPREIKSSNKESEMLEILHMTQGSLCSRSDSLLVSVSFQPLPRCLGFIFSSSSCPLIICRKVSLITICCFWYS